MKEYDLAIIGGGPGGYSSALRGAASGLSVAIVERDKIGGACLNQGCVPAKAWISAAETVDHAKHMRLFAAHPFDYSIDFKKVASRQKEIVSRFRKSLRSLIIKRGITIYEGEGRFVSPDTISIAGGGSHNEIKFKNAVIATGSSPARLYDLPDELMLDSSTIFEIETLPRSLLIVGAGAIGCEFAGALARMGVEVTLVELEDRILPMEDIEISATLEREFKKAKIKIVTGAVIEDLSPFEDGLLARLEDGREIKCGKALISVGRSFNTDRLGLLEAGVKVGDRKEVWTDETMRASASNIYAVGDVAGKNLLAYTAYKEGEMVADIVSGKNIKPAKRVTPNTIFTIPEIGSAGLTQDQAPASARRGLFMFRGLSRAHAEGAIAGFVKVIADDKTDKLLGVHIIGPRATDLIHIASIAISQGLTSLEFGDLVFAHPTFSEAIGEAALDIHNLSLHQ